MSNTPHRTFVVDSEGYNHSGSSLPLPPPHNHWIQNAPSQQQQFPLRPISARSFTSGVVIEARASQPVPPADTPPTNPQGIKCARREPDSEPDGNVAAINATAGRCPDFKFAANTAVHQRQAPAYPLPVASPRRVVEVAKGRETPDSRYVRCTNPHESDRVYSKFPQMAYPILPAPAPPAPLPTAPSAKTTCSAPGCSSGRLNQGCPRRMCQKHCNKTGPCSLEAHERARTRTAKTANANANAKAAHATKMGPAPAPLHITTQLNQDSMSRISPSPTTFHVQRLEAPVSFMVVYWNEANMMHHTFVIENVPIWPHWRICDATGRFAALLGDNTQVELFFPKYKSWAEITSISRIFVHTVDCVIMLRRAGVDCLDFDATVRKFYPDTDIVHIRQNLPSERTAPKRLYKRSRPIPVDDDSDVEVVSEKKRMKKEDQH
ncbi:hypothetical protein GGX14DRAFT_610159 [Mycena pura]|uniref:Uncharacterized protein n=1 Tax=Mycena pura TaxID=153505 RepID=A0AAD6VSJ3_9AGAR|nr:hypothetical protein GGX14DRAFT_610159 [Mycena pura]